MLQTDGVIKQYDQRTRSHVRQASLGETAGPKVPLSLAQQVQHCGSPGRIYLCSDKDTFRLETDVLSVEATAA